MDSPKTNFANKLILWYQENKRDLPWRHTRDAYSIWLSEIILQQTRVQQGTPYYYQFLEAFPTVSDFANASETEVLRLWQGLGYYSRARNMHATARKIVDQFDGVFPREFKQLIQLKGIGLYSAAAIASFSSNEKVAAIDGNAFRVLSRIFGIFTDISSTKAKTQFMEFAGELQPATQAGEFNQALIEFGALQCKPVAPDCAPCTFNTDCYARIHKMQSALPVKTKKTKIVNRAILYYILIAEGKIAMKMRTGNDIWKGLFDFPNAEQDDTDKLYLEALSGETTAKTRTTFSIGPVTHILSHQKLSLTFRVVRLDSLDPPLTLLDWYTPEEIHSLPKPVVIDKILNHPLLLPYLGTQPSDLKNNS